MFKEPADSLSEFARVFGVDFTSVYARGSQFKVESLMIRLAKLESFVLVSPSKHQVAVMDAPQCIPLVMEPESAFYEDPVIVLDFQSLYPSIMIAYNYCYSTCLGRISPEAHKKLGAYNVELDPTDIVNAKGRINCRGSFQGLLC